MRKVMEAAYAKVNLTLTVTGRRADGYHTIESLFQSVSLCDKHDAGTAGARLLAE